MRKTLMAALILWGGAALAQKPAVEPSPAVLQHCLLNTPADIWTTLQLNSDQLRRMVMVQEACTEECEAAGRKKPEQAISNADGSTVMSEVKNILTEEQYAAWVKYCTSAPGVPAPK